MRYSNERKAEYLRLCRQYNFAKQDLVVFPNGDGALFIAMSLALQIAKATVPIRWGLPGFISSQGM